MERILITTSLFLTFVGLTAWITFKREIAPSLQEASTINLAFDIRAALINYRLDYGTLPESNEAAFAAIKGNNPEQKDYLTSLPIEMITQSGIIDGFGNAMNVTITEQDVFVESAGRNGTFGDEDDITHDSITQVFAYYYAGLKDPEDDNPDPSQHRR